MLGQKTAGREIVDADKVEVAAMGERHHVTIKQHDRNARFTKAFRDAVVGLLLPVGEIKGSEEDTRNAPLDKLFAQFHGVLLAHVLVLLRVRGITP